jgi:arylsulfatase A-like enzyme
VATRPNFLLFITDQHRADYLGCYGHPVLKTPNIDAIAERGTRFTRFYVATPVCMPNRATLMTGRMPSVHGVRSNGSPLSLQSNTFVDALRASGYATALVGKSHLPTGPMTRSIPSAGSRVVISR